MCITVHSDQPSGLKLQCCANCGKFYHIPKYSRPWLKLRLFIYVPYPSEGLKLHTTITTTYCATMLQYFTKKQTNKKQIMYNSATHYYLLQLCLWKLIIIANFWRQSCQVIIIELVMLTEAIAQSLTGYQKRTRQFLRALHFYRIDSFVAFWLKCL